MFHSRVINNKINRLHERCFRLLHGDKSSSFEKLLEQDESVAIHARNLQILATEMLKVYSNISPPIFSEIFHRRDINYNFQINSPDLCCLPCHVLFCGGDTNAPSSCF